MMITVAEQAVKSHRATSSRLRAYADDELISRGLNAVWANQYRHACNFFYEASRRDPKNPLILIELAKCHHQLCEIAERDDLLRRVRRLFSLDSRIALLYAEACESMRLLDSALNAYTRAYSNPETRLEALARRANLLERMNRLQDAARDINEAISLRNVNALVHLVHARLLTRRGEYDRARSCLEPLVDRLPQLPSDHPDQSQCEKACYQLARILDHLGEYERVFSVLETVKSRRSQHPSATVGRIAHNKIRTQVDEMIETVSAPDVVQWEAECSYSRTGPIFIIGHPRSGTTLVERVLQAHSDVIVLDESRAFHHSAVARFDQLLHENAGQSIGQVLKEMDECDVNKIRDGYWRRVETLLGRPIGDCTFIDKNPVLTTHVPLILRIFPQAKFVYVRRDPRDVCISAYMNDMGLNDWSVNWLSLADTVDLYAFVAGTWDRFKDALSPRFIEVDYEDIIGDIHTTGCSLCNFIGIDWQKCQAQPEQKKHSDTYRSPSYADITKPIHTDSVGRWQNYKEQLLPYVATLAPFLSERIVEQTNPPPLA